MAGQGTLGGGSGRFERLTSSDWLVETRRRHPARPTLAYDALPALYCSSVTCLPQVTGLPDSSFCCMVMWTMNRLGKAPCQWFSPGSKNTRSPGRNCSIGPPSRWQRPMPSVTKIRLAVPVGVPRGTRAGSEVHERGGERRRRLGRGDGVDVDGAGEPVGRALPGVDARTGDQHAGLLSGRRACSQPLRWRASNVRSAGLRRSAALWWCQNGYWRGSALIASRRSTSAAESFRSAAARLSASCSSVRAPTASEVTAGLANVYASATCAGETP